MFFGGHTGEPTAYPSRKALAAYKGTLLEDECTADVKPFQRMKPKLTQLCTLVS